ncbi:MAG TPA: glutamate formimidoyltransferase [Anaerolineales bacterium]|nr:glutamate formimidoyltransferase [Anaerolineales bacterium]
MSLIECIPNFSEGRRPEVLQAIVSAIRAHGADVLDYSLDADHNRSVVTFVGNPTQVEAAGFAAIATASQLINLEQHVGQHPRIGATDVFPLVELGDTPKWVAVEVAMRLARRVATELAIPTYLYEFAHPERRSLPEIRQGGYELLKEVIATDPHRAPDFGPLHLGTAGATVIGVRKFLLAYNIFLASDDARLARKIAKSIRQSSGGLPGVRALGLLVRGRAQVSMNIVDFSQTSLWQVRQAVQVEAEALGVQVAESELIGMLPAEAVIQAARQALQLPELTEQRVLELTIQRNSRII